MPKSNIARKLDLVMPTSGRYHPVGCPFNSLSWDVKTKRIFFADIQAEHLRSTKKNNDDGGTCFFCSVLRHQIKPGVI